MSNLPAKRVVLYARYSTDMQQERSVEDQFALDREYAARQGWVVVGTYCDRERTSKTLFDRPGAIQMLREASQGRFDIILTEHFDRLSRSGEDLYGIFNKLKFDRVELHSVSQGVATDELIGIYALTGQLFLKGLSEKVTRGMVGRAKEGRVVAGLTYGYRKVLGKPGEREIDPEQAKIVERVFMEYIGGDSPRNIAARLQAEGIPAPGRTPWSWQNISGGRSSTEARGILNNRMYLGEVRFGLTKQVFNPSTGKHVRRKGDKPVIVHVEELRIIPNEMFERAKQIMESRHKVSDKPRKLWARNDSILAGILNCSVCGAHMIVSNRSRDGSGRFSCSAAYYRDECSHTKSYDGPRLEAAILDRLAEQLGDHRLIEIYLNEYLEERKTDQRAARAERERIMNRLDEIDVEQMRLAVALQKGTMPERILVPMVQALENERAGLEERKRVADQKVDIVDLHPAVIAQYRQAVETLQAELQSGSQTPEARIAFRTLVESIDVLPTPARAPYEWRIKGRLGALLGFNPRPIGRPAGQVLETQGISAVLSCYDTEYAGNAGYALSQQVVCLGTFVERSAA
jgi:DNA invertase Pin-like site-specific DNA recombinase